MRTPVGRRYTVVSEVYCSKRLRISGARHQVPPRLRPSRLGPWPYTISVVKSFRGSLIWVLWRDFQALSDVAATPLADSTLSDHDSPNPPATARSVYVITHPATRPMCHPRWFGGPWPDPDG